MSDDLRERIAEAVRQATGSEDKPVPIADAVLAVVQPDDSGWCPSCECYPTRLLERAEQAEAERDEARAALARLRAFIAAELDGICLNGEGALEAFDRRDRHIAALRTDPPRFTGTDEDGVPIDQHGDRYHPQPNPEGA